MTNSSERQVVITGIGIVSPLGGSREESWRHLHKGESGLRWLHQPESNSHTISQPSPDRQEFNATTTLNKPQQFSKGLLAGGTAQQFLIENDCHHEPVIQFALQTAREALQDAQIDLAHCDLERFGCSIGTSKGGFQSISNAYTNLFKKEQASDSSSGWKNFAANRAAVEVANKFNLQGPVLCPVAACATGLVSLMQGANLITNGYCDTVLAGSSDASLLPILLGAYDRMGVLANHFENPASACKPFDKNRDGFLVGEGAAMFLLEDASHAKGRGITPYAQWVTGSLATDVSGLTSLENDATSLSWLIQNVLQHSHITASEIDYINLHGTATKLNDLYETNAIKKACGHAIDNIPCSSLKGSLGHLLGAAGSVETAFSLLAMRDNIVPPTLNLSTADPQCDLNQTSNIAVSQEINTLLKLSFGFGGHLAAAVFRAV